MSSHRVKLMSWSKATTSVTVERTLQILKLNYRDEMEIRIDCGNEAADCVEIWFNSEQNEIAIHDTCDVKEMIVLINGIVMD